MTREKLLITFSREFLEMLKASAILLVSAASCVALAQEHVTSAADSGTSLTSGSASRATLQVTGNVIVNPHPVTDATSVVVKGDRIQTASAAAARISAPGLSLYLASNSCLTYRGQEFEMCSCGSLDVNAMKPASVVFHDRELVVSSQEPHSAFALNAFGPDVELINRHGTAEVAKSGSILTKLGPGSSRSFADSGCATAVPDADVVAGHVTALAGSTMISIAVIKATANRSAGSFNP
jgi:hypothetical protein